jgi:hypothetical protein
MSNHYHIHRSESRGCGVGGDARHVGRRKFGLLCAAEQNGGGEGSGCHGIQQRHPLRLGRKADKEKFEETFSFELATLPMLQEKSAAERCDYLKTLIGNAGREARIERGATKSMGMEKCAPKVHLTALARPKTNPDSNSCRSAKNANRSFRQCINALSPTTGRACSNCLSIVKMRPRLSRMKKRFSNTLKKLHR